jgi:hypothetical protein
MTAPDRLEELLEREPHIDDAGFTERVLAALPARRRDPRLAILATAAALASALGALFLPGAVAGALEAIAAWRPPSALPPDALLAGLAAALGAAAAAWGAVEAGREV